MSNKKQLPQFRIPEELKTVLSTDLNTSANISTTAKMFFDIIQQLKKINQLDISEVYYRHIFKLAWYLEEFQQSIDHKKYNIYNQTIVKQNNDTSKIKYKISIKDFDKDHPLHKGCNRIKISDPNAICEKKYIAYVNEIKDGCVIFSTDDNFHVIYKPKTEYNIEIEFNNYVFRCSHHALSSLDSSDLKKYLFPMKTYNVATTCGKTFQKWFNESIATNPEQKQAVMNIVNKMAYPAPHILYGPPGTGKTATLVETICQIYNEKRGDVLICTPSNAAADEITKRLLKYIPNSIIYRFYSFSVNTSQICKDIRSCSNCVNNTIVKVDADVFNSKQIIICTLCQCMKFFFMDLKKNFSYVFIDEAGQSAEPQALIPLSIISNCTMYKCQIVIAGDPKQLGPTVRSKHAEPILGQSILERLMKLDPYRRDKNNKYDSRYITKLLRNYRSHPAIIQISNKLYYDNELISCGGEKPVSKNSTFPVIFHAVMGKEKKVDDSTSCFNSEEIKKVLLYVNLLIGKKIGNKVIQDKDIGIVTPFTLQSTKLQSILQKQNLKNVTVGTVEIFQGQEKEVIIISTVRSKIFVHEEQEHLGFLSSPRRFNVAITRARALLIVIGNPNALQKDPNWQYLIQYCCVNDSLRGSEFKVCTNEIKMDSDVKVDLKSKLSNDVVSKLKYILRINDGIVINQKPNSIHKYSSTVQRRSNNECLLPSTNKIVYSRQSDDGIVINQKPNSIHKYSSTVQSRSYNADYYRITPNITNNHITRVQEPKSKSKLCSIL